MEQQAASAIAAASHALVRLLVLSGLVLLLWLLLGVASAHADGHGLNTLPDVRQTSQRAVDRVATIAHRATNGATDPVVVEARAVVAEVEGQADGVVHQVRESVDPVDLTAPIPAAPSEGSSEGSSTERDRESSMKQGDSRRAATSDRWVRTPHVLAAQAQVVEDGAGRLAPTSSRAAVSDPRAPSSPFQAPDVPLSGLASAGAAEAGSGGGSSCAALLDGVDAPSRSASGSLADTAAWFVPGPSHSPGCTPD